MRTGQEINHTSQNKTIIIFKNILNYLAETQFHAELVFQ